MSITYTSLLEPYKLRSYLPLSPSLEQFVQEARSEIQAILTRKDKRFLVVVGPCSIHDVHAGLVYAKKLSEASIYLKDRLCIVMRTYFEKPRTALGWKGLILDPDLNHSYKIEEGLKISRTFLHEVLNLNLPTGTEFLDPITPNYLEDSICWSAIGARTVESQVHRQLGSFLKMPLGFKNNTAGSIASAIYAMQAAQKPQSFLGINLMGKVSMLKAQGNPYGHIILRGGTKKPNYQTKYIEEAINSLTHLNLAPNVMVDCAHGNSSKHGACQNQVLKYTLKHLQKGLPIIGIMIESNIYSGSQNLPNDSKLGDLKELKYGVSITDPCLSWEETKNVLNLLYESLDSRFTS